MKVNADKVSDLIDRISDLVCLKISCYDCPAWSNRDDCCMLEKIRNGFYKNEDPKTQKRLEL